MAVVRTDGQSIRENPKLQQALDIDRKVCEGETQKAALSGVTIGGGSVGGLAAAIERQESAKTVMIGCMAQRGYVLVPQEQAAAALESYRQTQGHNAGEAPPIVTGSTPARAQN
jgi:hypothetical protein